MFNPQMAQQQALVNYLQNAHSTMFIFDEVLRAQEVKRQWDGWLHVSDLNWNQEPDKQLDTMIKGYGTNLDIPELRSNSHAGDVFHGTIQRLFDNYFGPAHAEHTLFLPNYCLRGTPDRVQLGSLVGNILWEFKTKSRTIKDSTGKERLLKQIYKIAGDSLTINSSKFNEADFLDRLSWKTNVIEVPEHDHMTQIFTYSWMWDTLYKVIFDWTILVYVDRASLQPIAEFVWYKDEARTIAAKERAHVNAHMVAQCLAKRITKEGIAA